MKKDNARKKAETVLEPLLFRHKRLDGGARPHPEDDLLLPIADDVAHIRRVEANKVLEFDLRAQLRGGDRLLAARRPVPDGDGLI